MQNGEAMAMPNIASQRFRRKEEIRLVLECLGYTPLRAVTCSKRMLWQDVVDIYSSLSHQRVLPQVIMDMIEAVGPQKRKDLSVS